MSAEWTKVTLADAPLTIMDGDRGTNYPSQDDFSSVGHCLFLNTGNVTTDGFNFSNCAFITVEKDAALRKGKLCRDDVVLTTRGTVGNVGFFGDSVQFEHIRINSGMVILRADQRQLSSYFLYLFVRSALFMEQVKSLQSGSAQPQLPIRDMKRIEIPIPSMPDQVDICAVLGALDDRITLLRETNATLEAIAQALFKSWFVDFDPVRAKMEGRAPEGMDEATAALFPDSFEESELGLMPKGWRAGTLADLAEFQNGYAFKSKDWVDLGHPVVKIGDVKPGIIDFSGCSFVAPETTAGLDRFRLNRGDLLVGMTGYVGETGLVAEVAPAAYLNQRVGRIATADGMKDGGFVYCLVRAAEFKVYAVAQSHGSAQANVSGSALLDYASIIPDADVRAQFSDLIYPILESILSNHEQAQTLATLRDTLLPRLISGQLRLPEFEAQVAEANV